MLPQRSLWDPKHRICCIAYALYAALDWLITTYHFSELRQSATQEFVLEGGGFWQFFVQFGFFPNLKRP